MAVRMRESVIQSAILDYLAARRILAFRMQTGAIKLERRFIRFGVPGMADILACPQFLNDQGDWIPTFLWIEVKSGTKQTALQKSFEQHVTEHGHRYIVAKSIDDVEAALR